MKQLVIISFFILFIFGTNAQNENINTLLNEINSDSLKKTVMDMQAFSTRFCLQNNKQVAQYIIGRLQQYGITNAAIDSFHVQGESWIAGKYDCWMYNVKGQLTGNISPDSIIILGAHFDAISYDTNKVLYTTTGGSDDNASGIAVMIEMARIFQKYNLKPRYSIAFMGYDGEELGLFGSTHDAYMRWAYSEKIVYMQNNDMVGNQPEDTTQIVFLNWYDNALNLVKNADAITKNYTSLTPYIPDSANNKHYKYSDSYSYYLKGFKTVYFSEYKFSPYYHSLNDLYTYCNFEYMKEITKLNMAFLYHHSIEKVYPENIDDCTINLTQIQLFPNPANNQTCLQFNISEPTELTITLCNIMGKEILCLPSKTYTIGNHEININCQSITSGMYFCTLQSNENSKTVKLIIKK